MHTHVDHHRGHAGPFNTCMGGLAPTGHSLEGMNEKSKEKPTAGWPFPVQGTLALSHPRGHPGGTSRETRIEASLAGPLLWPESQPSHLSHWELPVAQRLVERALERWNGSVY